MLFFKFNENTERRENLESGYSRNSALRLQKKKNSMKVE